MRFPKAFCQWRLAALWWGFGGATEALGKATDLWSENFIIREVLTLFCHKSKMELIICVRNYYEFGGFIS